MTFRIFSTLGLLLTLTGFASETPQNLRTNALGGLASAADLSPFWDYKTIETAHFRITFDSPLVDVAQKAARYYEKAHALLSPMMRWSPSLKTQVLLVDNTDLANGFSTPALRIGMVLMVTPPEAFFSTSYYDDWLWLLVVHEYTHFLNMDVTQGLYSALRILAGDSFLPNTLWPTWMLEGLAVYTETRFTTAGRGRSPYFSMLQRAAVESKTLGQSSFATFNEIQGRKPTLPAGETPYFFGYQLMNQAAHQDFSLGWTFDQLDELKSGDDLLGSLSYRSGARVPFFISGNLQNHIGKTWDQIWSEWINQTERTANEQLEKIKTQPVTSFEPLTDAALTPLGFALSPDGKWLARTQDNSDHRMSLTLTNLETHQTETITQKIMGSKMMFSADSKYLIFSSIRRLHNYYLVSDLVSYSIESQKIRWLTDGLRVRDPALSADQKWIAFTLTKNQTTGLAWAPIHWKDGPELNLDEMKPLFFGPDLSRVSTPVFDPRSKKIYFSFHDNRKKSEEIWSTNLETGESKPEVTDFGFCGAPFFGGPTEDLHFTSDVSGVLNLYRQAQDSKQKGKTQNLRLTNFTTGGTFGFFDQKGNLYSQVFHLDAEDHSFRGWRVSRLMVDPKGPTFKPETLPVFSAPEPSPQIQDEIRSLQGNTQRAEVKDYSVWPSILPRAWYFLPTFDRGSIYFNGIVTGFDAVDEHRYFINTGYDSLIKKPDLSLAYENRSFGPTLTLLASEHTTSSTRLGDQIGSTTLLSITREQNLVAEISYPFSFTYSTLMPTLGAQVERATNQYPTLGGLELRGRWVPSYDAYITFTDLLSSRLAIGPENGRLSLIGVRHYANLQPGGITKALIKDREYFTLFDHVTLSPSVVGSMVNRQSREFSDADVNVKGRKPTLISSLSNSNFDQLGVRGYPQKTFLTRAAAVGALEIAFPVARLFTGWSTRPVFLENLSGFGFTEGTVLSRGDFLPSFGTGLKLTSTIFSHLPILVTSEFHQGLNTGKGGKGEWFVTLGLGNLDL